ncbi:MAG: fructosamine kinase family protein [Marinilabiliaceae bacterium]|nr:fructosamine kinase family protein [Marinilabiliaceae bacterium]
MKKSSLIHHIENLLNDTIIEAHSVGGGCIAQTQILKTGSGQSFFLKQGFSNSMFLNEANGLKELAKSKTIRVPQVVAAERDFLLLEHITPGRKKPDFFESFGKAYAEMHRYTHDTFGFYEDNFIGATPQINAANDKSKNNWTSFYFDNRLLYQFKLAEQNGYVTEEFRKAFAQIENRIESILKGSEEPPALLHGDLWGGNFMVDDQGEPVLIDPAVYYGHREADLAMTKLFGGFTNAFYLNYNAYFPLKEGYAYRENIYLLYHVLNHLNLFGISYYQQAMKLMKRY